MGQRFDPRAEKRLGGARRDHEVAHLHQSLAAEHGPFRSHREHQLALVDKVVDRDAAGAGA